MFNLKQFRINVECRVIVNRFVRSSVDGAIINMLVCFRDAIRREKVFRNRGVRFEKRLDHREMETKLLPDARITR